ncbi:uncharacterized protein N7484_008942 [Penicillium longicatenatum]|uniref:uncharacterized protein n=1 Tax=Penicillium longicatenatum TaxID=1561947 RepID=UPI0025494673|nr:uncharacterized protein N7484_008942 [Penicillium longicatenatum]KAJ5635629.1 hypothetical protein N7484_008942 [Penicillium longicatenatum]
MASFQGSPSILFHDNENTVFLVDLPGSIAQAQEILPTTPAPTGGTPSISNQGNRKHKLKKRSLISSVPLTAPYLSLTEPKTDTARAKVLSNISLCEQRFHGEYIQPLVANALDDLRAGYMPSGSQWCLPRAVLDATVLKKEPLEISDSSTKKRKRKQPRNRHCSPSNQLGDGRSSLWSAAPPTILSSTSLNIFSSMSELEGVVKNPSSDETVLSISTVGYDGTRCSLEYIIPPRSAFVLCNLPLSQSEPLERPIPGLPSNQRFNLMLFDPPWPNRSVRRSKGYQTHAYNEVDILSLRLQDILRAHAYCPLDDVTVSSATTTSTNAAPEQVSQETFAAIWITNSEKARRVAYEALLASGFRIHEEWVWIKITADGQAVCPLDGLWRKPYEILVIGRKDPISAVSDLGYATSQGKTDTINLLDVDPSTITRRVIAAVPDLHSRKPNLKPIFERVLFGVSDSTRKSYSALEVFARSLTSEWWACGNEVVKFNARDNWVET